MIIWDALIKRQNILLKVLKMWDFLLLILKNYLEIILLILQLNIWVLEKLIVLPILIFLDIRLILIYREKLILDFL